MGVPKRKRTPSAKKRSASHLALKPRLNSICPKCKKPIRPHHACTFCGYYKGKEVIKIRVSKEEKALIKKDATSKKTPKKTEPKK
jgi:large subunit ribosomal protein L32